MKCNLPVCSFEGIRLHEVKKSSSVCVGGAQFKGESEGNELRRMSKCLEEERVRRAPDEGTQLAEQMYSACGPGATRVPGACTTFLLDIMSTRG